MFCPQIEHISENKSNLNIECESYPFIYEIFSVSSKHPMLVDKKKGKSMNIGRRNN